MTGPFTTNIPGLFSAGEAALAERLGWPLKDFREAFREVSRKPLVKADWKAHLVFVPNAIKYNVPQNPNVVKGWADVWDELPECELKAEAYQNLKSFLEGFNECFVKAFTEACRKYTPKQEHEQESPLPPKGTVAASTGLQPEGILQKWNTLPGVKPCKALDATLRDRIRIRLSEHPDPTWWDGFFQQVAAADFLCGRTNGTRGAFHATLDWVLGPKNLGKILRGNYDQIRSANKERLVL